MSALLAALALVVTQTNVTFAWGAPAGEFPEYYTVLVSETGAGMQMFATETASISLDLDVGKEFSIRVAACGQGICGAWSPASEPVSLNYSADLSGDSTVGLPDYSLVIAQIGQTTPNDLNGDGIMGLEDLNIVRGRIGQCIGEITLDGQPIQAYVPCGESAP
jgi:hypothetical protein